MTEIDDRELSRRLRALRVEPPLTGFDARLAESLLAAAPEPTPTRRREGRVIVGPWLRRGPARLIGATALLVAGAAAALEGGVIEWVQARVESVRSREPAPSLPAPPSLVAPPSAAERPRPERERVEPAPAPAEAIGGAPRAEAPPRIVPPEPVPNVPRVGAERAHAPRRDAMGASPERRPALDPPVIPRLDIDPRGRGARSEPDIRLGRGVARPGDVARDRGRELERIRDLAQARRQRGATERERPRAIERLRERRERLDSQRRDILQERGGRERRGPR